MRNILACLLSAWMALTIGFAAAAEGQDKPLEKGKPVEATGEDQAKPPEAAPSAAVAPPEVVLYLSDLPGSALSEFDFWSSATSPGGKMVGTQNTGDKLNPPPEDDPHVIFKVKVQSGVPYRCWIHMKVGAPKGVSQANKLYVQFSQAVDRANRDVLRPGTGSYLTAQGPTQPGWKWVGCDVAGSRSSDSLIHFRTSGEITVRVQAGMEGVGFDQFVLSPAQFLEKPPSEAVIKK